MHGFRFNRPNSAPPPRARHYLNHSLSEIERRVAGGRPCQLRDYARRLRLAAAELTHSRPLFAQLFLDVAITCEDVAQRREQRRQAAAERRHRTTFRPQLTGLAHFGRR